MKKAEEQIAKIIGRAAMMDPAKVRPETKLSELGIDSLARIECVLSLEDAFQVEFRDDELWSVRTVQDIINSVHRALAAEHA